MTDKPANIHGTSQKIHKSAPAPAGRISEQEQTVPMSTASNIPQAAAAVSDAILKADTDAERIQIAAGMLAYSLGALVALVGVQKASEIAYRHADAAVGIK